MKEVLRRTFHIHEGEGRRAFLMWSYLFLVIAALLVVKPASTSLFVSEFGARGLPLAYVAIAIAAGLVAVGYTRILASVSVERLIKASLQAGAMLLSALWVVHFVSELRGPVLYVFYVGVAVWGATSVSQFWILANTVFNAREAKRLFSFLGTGGIVGGAVGGYSTNLLAPLLGTEALLLLSAALLAACIPVVSLVGKHHPRHESDVRQLQHRFGSRRYSGGLRLIVRSRHLRLIAAIVGISVVVAKLIDYEFTAIATSAIPDEDRLTAFFAFWLSTFNLLSLAIQLFATRKVIALAGVARSLFVLPLAILFASGLVLVAPVLASAVVVRMTDASLKQSINKAGTELLYLPVPRATKGPAKTFVDVFVDAVATGLGGLLLLVSTLVFGLGTRWVAFLTVLLVLPWIYLIRQVRREYLNALRFQIDVTGSETGATVSDGPPPGAIEQFRDALAGDHPEIVRTALDKLPPELAETMAPDIGRLLEHRDATVVAAALRQLAAAMATDYGEPASRLLGHDSAEVRVEAIAYLFENADDRVELLRGYLEDPDLRIRTAAIVCAAREVRTNPDLKNALGLEPAVASLIAETPSLDATAQDLARSASATAIGEAGLERLYPYLHVFLDDSSPQVVEAGLLAASRSRRLELVGPIIETMDREAAHDAAVAALVGFGPSAFDTLRDALQDRHRSRAQSCGIIEALGTLDSQPVVDLLLKILEEDDYSLRYEATRSLNRLRRDYPNLRFNERQLEARIHRESTDYAEILAALQAQKRADPSPDGATTAIDDARDALITLLERRLDENLERIFRLLGLRYPPDAIHDAFRGLAADQPQELRASAVEFLDNLLDPDLRRVVIPLVESTFPDAVVDEVLERLELEIPSEKDCLDLLLATRDTEIVLRTLQLIEHTRPQDHAAEMASLMARPDKRVADFARRILSSIGLLTKPPAATPPAATGD